jgi:glycosyltransferase involved in cell wall biosynthesis
MSAPPLLSLCIPTYNRAQLLQPMLQSLCRQCASLGEDVEIVVSDNASTDATRAVVQAASSVYPITYSRNDRNVGSRNFLLAVERAAGEYAWVLGDDDLVLEGGLRAVTEALRAHREIDYFYVNYLSAPMDVRDRYILEGAAARPPDIDDCVVRDPESRRLDSWEHIFDLPTANAVEINTSILSSVFRREEWERCAGLLRMSQSPMVSAADTSLDDLFPHVKILAHAMVGRAGYYIAWPCSLMGQGGQEWLDDWWAITITGMNQALLLYERLGLDPQRLRRLWRSHFVRAVEFMPPFGVHRDAACMRGYDWGEYLWRTRHRWDVLAAVVARRLHPGTWLKTHLPAPLFAALRGVWQAAAQRAR